MTDSDIQQMTLAIDRYEGYRKLDPDNFHLLMTLADLYHRAGRFDDAQACYAHCLTLDPGHVVAKSRSANVMISQQRFADAEASLRTLTESAQPDPALLHNLGVSLFYQKRWDEALGAFQRAAQGGLRDRLNVLYTAHAMHRLGDVSGGAQLCREWLEQHPDEGLEGYLAVLEMDDGAMEQASQRALAVLARQPDNADAALVAGMWEIEKQEIDVAQSHVTTVLKAEPDSPRGLFAQGLIHMYKQEHAQAIASIEAALKFMPDHVGSVTTLGWAHFAARDIPAAERTFRRALDIDRSFGEAHGGLSVTLVFQNRLQEARREAQIAKRLDPRGLGAVWASGALMALDGKREAGEALVASALQNPITQDGKSAMEHLQHFFRQQAARSEGGNKRKD